MLDVKQTPEHVLQLDERVECLGGLVRKAANELGALAVHLLVLVLGRGSDNGAVELA